MQLSGVAQFSSTEECSDTTAASHMEVSAEITTLQNRFMADLGWWFTGGSKRFQSILDTIDFTANTHRKHELLPYLFDFSTSPSGIIHKEFTNQNEAWDASGWDAPFTDQRIIEVFWINMLLNHFITGTGPENIVFPLNGQVSECLRKAAVTKRALKKWALFACSKDSIDTFHCKVPFIHPSMIGILKNVFSLEHFIASADFVIFPNDNNKLYVAIFNVTSITSANILRHIHNSSFWPESQPRIKGYRIPYGNISQTFQLTFSWQEVEQITRRQLPVTH
jgi:hypothetical protein